jgi:hypothetical protein
MTGAAALAAVLLLGLAACDAGADTANQFVARRQAIDPPQLWLVQVIGSKGAASASIFVCADTALRGAFVRTRAEVNGELCQDTTMPVLKKREWALSCKAEGRSFTVSASTLGDLGKDFRLNFALTPLFDRTGIATVRQTRRFRHMGPCPVGWRIGDQAKPGHHPRKSRY